MKVTLTANVTGVRAAHIDTNRYTPEVLAAVERALAGQASDDDYTVLEELVADEGELMDLDYDDLRVTEVR